MPNTLQIIHHHLKETHPNLQISTIGKELLIHKNNDRSKMRWIWAETNTIIIESYDHNFTKPHQSITIIDLNEPNSLTEIHQTIEK